MQLSNLPASALIFAIALCAAAPGQAQTETTVRIGPQVLEATAPSTVAYTDTVDFTVVNQSRPGNAMAAVTAVDLSLGANNTSTSACEAADFAGFPAGNIALIQRGTCNFLVKLNNAVAAGASGVILFNQGDTPARTGLTNIAIGDAFASSIPVVFATYARGAEWSQTAGLAMRMNLALFRGASAESYLRYCLAWPGHCAISVEHVQGGWQRHYNADRLQVTASTFKIPVLLAYATAAAANSALPATVVSRDSWARYSVLRDGGALAAAYTRLGSPATVTLDQMVRAMIRESDNATPDWLLQTLGRPAMQAAVDTYIRGLHDAPDSINAIFVSMDGNPEDPNTGARVLASYPSGYADPSYREEVRELFDTRMQDPIFVQSVRDFTCLALPWATVPAPCTPGWRNTTATWRQLLGRYFTRSNTRTYLRLMGDILAGSLPPAVDAIVRPHLEWRLAEPGFAAFSRYGGKGGSFAPQDLCTWTSYMQNASTGDQVIVATMIRDSLHPCGFGIEPARFAEAITLDATFRARVRDEPALDEVRREGFEGL